MFENSISPEQLQCWKWSLDDIPLNNDKRNEEERRERKRERRIITKRIDFPEEIAEPLNGKNLVVSSAYEFVCMKLV